MTVRLGVKVPLKEPTYYEPETSIVHFVDEKGDERFAQTIQGPAHPEQPGAINQQAMDYVNFIVARLNSALVDVYKQTYETPVVDPMFMEPEAGLACFDRRAKTLRMLIGTQSPGCEVNSSRALFAPEDCAIGIDDVHLFAAYPGGGFGGRETSTLSVYLALAAAYSELPIRIAKDRFQQFQSGVKRHASHIELTVGINEHHAFEAIRNHSVLNCGGQRNVSTYVADVNGVTGVGAYWVPLADICLRSRHTQSQVAGSMRGFGSFQSTFAIKSLVDEIAVDRGLDPLEFRKINLLEPHESVVTGAPKAPPGLHEICDRALVHQLWTGREADRDDLSTADEAYGVGASVCMKNFGSGADAMMSKVRIEPNGRVVVTTTISIWGRGQRPPTRYRPARRWDATPMRSRRARPSPSGNCSCSERSTKSLMIRAGRDRLELHQSHRRSGALDTRYGAGVTDPAGDGAASGGETDLGRCRRPHPSRRCHLERGAARKRNLRSDPVAGSGWEDPRQQSCL